MTLPPNTFTTPTMPSPRNSRFTENFDDSSDTSSQESLSSTSSPEHTCGSIPTQLMQKFSAMMLRHTASRSPRQDSGMVSQSQSPVQVQMTEQTQMSVAAQDNEAPTVGVPSEESVATLDDSLVQTLALDTDKTSDTPSDDETTTETHNHNKEKSPVDVKIFPEEPNASVVGQPEHKPETTPEKNGDSPTPEHDPKQPKPHTSARFEPTPNFETVVKLFDEVLTANNINTGTLTDNFNRLVQDMQRFHQQRDETAFKFQKCYSSHSRTKTSPAKCVDCFLYVEKIEHGYIQMCLKIKKMIEELSQSIRDSFLKLGVHREIPDQEHVNDSVLDEMMVHLVNMQRLVETEDMLRSLKEDAEAGLGWPEVSLSEGAPEADQGPKTQLDEEASADLVAQNEDTDHTKSSEFKSKKGKSKQQKKKKGKR